MYGKDVEGSVVAKVKVLSRNFPGRTEDTYEKYVRPAGLRTEI
jgi:hypothetical protein